MALTFALLGLAICAVWLPSVQISGHWQMPPWIVLFVAAIAAGLTADILAPIALTSLTATLALAWASRRDVRPLTSACFTALAAGLSLALSLHLLPGFHNPTLVVAEKLSPDGRPFTQYLNFDKGSAGLVLLGVYAPRLHRTDRLRAIAIATGYAIGLTAFAVFGVACLVKFVRLDPKFPDVAWAFLVTNLLFTCVAEEAFFRGLLQERMALCALGTASAAGCATSSLKPTTVLRLALPVTASALLFAAAHAAGGPLLVLMAGVAGLGYALVYAFTRRIEAPLLTHFAVNAIHFVGFTFPALAR